jgi:hypothetical protein
MTMLKTYPTSFLLPKRLKLAPLIGRFEPDSTSTCPAAQQQTNCLSTDTAATATATSSFSPPHDTSQPVLLAPHSRLPQNTMADAEPKSRRPNFTYFPLGYKEAVQQWVSRRWSNSQHQCLFAPTNFTCSPVDKCITPPGRAKGPLLCPLPPRGRDRNCRFTITRTRQE